MAINDQGRLEIGGCDVPELAARYGTPLYVIDEELVRKTCRAYLDAFAAAYPNAQVIYAGKAFLTTAFCRIVEQEGLALDVVSGGELHTALHADFPPSRIFFHGNNKSRAELEMAVAAGVHRVVVDNLHELETLQSVARAAGRQVDILLRLTPGIEASTHAYIQTGQVDSKFGFTLADGVALKAVERSLNADSVRLRGFHSHVGSQIFDLSVFDAAANALFSFVELVGDRFQWTCEEINLGGGLGIAYTKDDDSVDVAAYAQRVSAAVQREAQARGMSLPRLMVEPGRSIVGDAGTTIYTVGSVKDIPGVRTYVAVDGGMTDNPRVALYGAKYEAVVANKAGEALKRTVSVAGKCCESGDMLIWDLEVPDIEPGDVLAVMSTGAYNYSMASNYNRLPRPAAALVYKGNVDVIVARESYKDLVKRDRMPARLAKPADEAAPGSVEQVEPA